jgi:ATP-dependent helicase HrpA
VKSPTQRPDPAAVARSLPIYEVESRIVEAVREHPVVVLEGPTGSGKTTQIPRMLKAAGFGEKGLIGVTQPRRIAAVSVAHRIAQEEGVALGEEVGYTIRFDDSTGPRTRIKVMTDGILLQEARTDPELSRYSVIVVDEAHERSLNIDFCLGLLHRLVQRRRELRVLVTSATMRPEEFQAFFGDATGEEVPRISIDARVFPVTVHYRELRSAMMDEIVEVATREMVAIHKKGVPGHVLAFFTGAAMIQATQAALAHARLGRGVVVLPLYGRLPREEQELVFDDFGERRKLVLATNIAETSITIPDVRYVIDCGLAKVPRFDARTGIETLREEPISRASAEQRAGRAGRTAPGEVVRLYTRDELWRMPEYTEEEIRRLDLSEVVLRLIDLGVRDVEGFPFPTRPQRGKLRAAIEYLTALGAIDPERHLTDIGHRMVPFPLSPALGRMVVEAANRFPNVVEEVLVVAGFLSARPPFLFPLGQEEEARRAQAEWAHPLGDLLALVDLFWAWARSKSRDKFCERHFLDKDIMAFVQKAHDQLSDIARQYDIEVQSGGPPEAILRCVGAGFPDKVLRRGRGAYETEKGERISIHPGSALYGQRPLLIVAAEIVVSTRPYARQVSVFNPDWLAEVRPDLAEAWRMGGRARRDRKGVEVPELPRRIEVGGVALKVKLRGGRPHVDIPLQAVERLSGQTLLELDPTWAKWSARVLTGYGNFGSGLRLAQLLALLPVMPLPARDDAPAADIPEGALLTIEENWPTLEWLLTERLLLPALPMAGRRPGWAAFVANGLGAYWFEVIRDFKAAVQTSVLSLAELLSALPEEQPARGALAQRHEELLELEERIEAARTGNGGP